MLGHSEHRRFKLRARSKLCRGLEREIRTKDKLARFFLAFKKNQKNKKISFKIRQSMLISRLHVPHEPKLIDSICHNLCINRYLQAFFDGFHDHHGLEFLYRVVAMKKTVCERFVFFHIFD